MIGLGIVLLTAAVVVLIIGISLFMDAKREYDTHIEKANRNFGFPKKKIDIDRKDEK